MYTWVQKTMQKAFSYISKQYDEKLMQNLLFPSQVIEFYFPVNMDDGSVKVFKGMRAQHNNTRWPFKWWLRYHENVTKEDVTTLATWMTFKCSVVNIPLWWGKWGVVVNPKELSEPELERLTRAFTRKLVPHIWHNLDSPAPDVNTNGQIMARILDEYQKATSTKAPWVVTWKPIHVWWSLGREKATAQWWLYVLNAYLAKNMDTLKWKTIAIQWAWNVGMNFALLAEEAWATIVAISDSWWWIYDKKGLDMHKTCKLKDGKQCVLDYKWAKAISNKELLNLKVDILVPAAIENVITDKNASKIKAKLILELANWPITSQADDILQKNDIQVIPDILANAGGVTVSYFEQVQNTTNFYRSEHEVNTRLKDIMENAAHDVIEHTRKYKTTLRNGAYIVSLKRLLEATKSLYNTFSP